VFVLILENRSFDHLLGFSRIAGTDATSGNETEISGLVDLDLLEFAKHLGANSAKGVVDLLWRFSPIQPPASLRDALTSNGYRGQLFRVQQGAGFEMPVDPGHEFTDVLMQLSGTYSYPPGSAYPSINNSGYVTSYVANGGSTPGEIMKCYDSLVQLPVLSQLAQEFVVCDNWYSSLPGPTWPNRFFAHAASSGGLDHSPSQEDIVEWEVFDGFGFQNGTIFDRMSNSNLSWRIYSGDNFPQVAGLAGIHLWDIHDYNNFLHDVAQPNYPVSYTFIEPSYGHFWSDYRCGTSQHPQDDITRGEALVKCTYEAIRNSPNWDSSMLIITYDEHGGFYDHAIPPGAVAPGDTTLEDESNKYGFTFEQLGPRIPALIISPLIPRNLIDHRTYDHSSIPATLEACFGLNAMTNRDAMANSLMSLVSLSNPRQDAPTSLNPPADSKIRRCAPFSCSATSEMALALNAPLPVTRHRQRTDGNLPGFLQIAAKFEMVSTPQRDRAKVIARFRSIKTRADAFRFLVKSNKNLQASTLRRARSGVLRPLLGKDENR
jgi:phospholipase C